MRELLLWGATGQAKVLCDIIHTTDINLVALVDNRSILSPVPGVPLLAGEEGLKTWLSQRPAGSDGLLCSVAVGGGHGGDRIMLMDLLQRYGLTLLTLSHPTAFVAHSATIGQGSQILAQSAVCACARLGRGVIINTSASVDHDGELGDGVHLGPGARLAGEVTVGARAFIGTGAVVLPRITIGEDAVVGAGAVVTKNVAPGMIVVGNPARPKL